MLETYATVIELDGTEAVVEGKQGGGCGNCDSENGCGSSQMAKIFSSKPRRFRVYNGIDASVGDEVQVSVADGALLRSALIMYILPLGLMLACGFLGNRLGDSEGSRDAYAVMGALFGLLAGFVFARRSAFTAPQPVISRCEKKHCDRVH